MSDFYSIKDPSFNLKDGKKYIVIDDWDNVLLAKYSKEVNMFSVYWDGSNQNDALINFIFDSDMDGYIASEPLLLFFEKTTRNEYNPMRDNRIEKILEFNMDTKGIKS